MKKLVIAIDGPAASGKSTTAKLLALRLGLLPIDTGAMYRAVTLYVLEKGVNPRDEEKVCEIAKSINIEQRFENNEVKTLIDNKDRTRELKSPLVSKWVSLISSYPGVRRALVEKQRKMAERGGVVLEGRDIGTVVLPNADVKIFMIAREDIRAQRRYRELIELGYEVKLEDVMEDLKRRDELDSTREDSPLSIPDDAITIDTTKLTVEEQVDLIIKVLRERGLIL